MLIIMFVLARARLHNLLAIPEHVERMVVLANPIMILRWVTKTHIWLMP